MFKNLIPVGISVVATIVILVLNHLKNKRDKEGILAESALYERLKEKFYSDNNKNGYLYKYREEYISIIKKADEEEIRHAISILSSILVLVDTEGLIQGLIPTLLSSLGQIYILGSPESIKSTIGILVNIITSVLAFTIWKSVLHYGTSARRYKFFLELLQFGLEQKQQDKQEKLKIMEKRIDILNKEIETLSEENKQLRNMSTVAREDEVLKRTRKARIKEISIQIKRE